MTPRPTLARTLTVAVMLLLTATACASPAGKEQPMPKTSEFSQLTDAGIAEIQRTRHARFDLRNHELTKGAVGLEGTTMGPIIGGPDQATITLELLGPTRTETVETKTMGFVSSGTADEPFDSVVFWREFDSVEQSLAELHDDITRWGLNPSRVQAWQNNSQGETNYQQFVSMGIGPSGLVVGVEAYLKNGKPLFKYEIYLEPKYYTPEALERTAKTGLWM